LSLCNSSRPRPRKRRRNITKLYKRDWRTTRNNCKNTSRRKCSSNYRPFSNNNSNNNNSSSRRSLTIKQNILQIIGELPQSVQLVAAAKTRTPREITEAIAAGVKIIGENYLQEAEEAYRSIGHQVEWHFIGHLQKNKVKKAVAIFDMIETVDSLEIASEIDKRCAQLGKTMPVLIEVNSGRESQKSGVFPEDTTFLIASISSLSHVRVMGLMTMGPPVDQPEESRRFFRETRQLFENIKKMALPNVEMKYLSMGMTDSYKIALEEGANIVRLGNKIFGVRAPEV
jgi:pyridoxal phosphate enzyme (YggS family)